MRKHKFSMRAVLTLAVLTAVIITGCTNTNSEDVQTSVFNHEITNEHPIDDDNNLKALCGTQGCEYPDNSYCTDESCYDKEGIIQAQGSTYVDLHNVDFTTNLLDVEDDDHVDVVEDNTTTDTPVVEDTSTEEVDTFAIDQAHETLGWDRDSYRGKEDEQRNMDRDTDLSEIKNTMASWLNALDRMETAVNNSDVDLFYQEKADADDARFEVDDAFTNAYSSSNYNGAKRSALEDKPKQLKDIERQLSELERNSRDLEVAPDRSKLDGYVAELQEIVSKLKELSDAVTSDLDSYERDNITNDMWDLISDFDYISGNFYDEINQINESVWSQQRVVDSRKNLRDKERAVRDTNREFKRLSKRFEGGKISALEKAIVNLTSFLEQIKAALDSNDSDALEFVESDFWDASQDAWYEINELNDIQNVENQAKDTERSLKEQKRWHKDKERECKRVKCEEGPAGTILTQMRVLLEKMEDDVKAEQYENFWDHQYDYQELDTNFWDLVSVKQSEKDIKRWLKDVSREWKDKGRWVADLEREARSSDVVKAGKVDRLQEIHNQAIEQIRKAESEYSAKSYDEARYILEDINDIRFEFDDIIQDFNEGREAEYFDFELEELEEDLQRSEASIDDLLARGEIDENKATICRGYIGEGHTFLTQLIAVKESGQIGEMEEIWARLDNLGNKAERECGDVFDAHKADFRGFNDHFVPEDLQGIADEIFERMSLEIENRVMNKVLDRMADLSSNFNDMIERFGEKFEERIAQKLETISFISEEYQEELLSRAATIFEKIDALENQTNNLIASQLDRYNHVRDDILGYNFYGSAAGEIEDLLEDFQGSNQDESDIRNLEQKVTQIKVRAIEEKFALKIVPFRDTDDHEWFTRHVAEVADRGIVKGMSDAFGNPTGFFNPGANVTIGEMLKMSLEAANMGQAPGSSRLARAHGHWAEGYVLMAENLGMDIVSGLDSLDRPAKRSEVVRAALQARGIVPRSVSVSAFSDVPGSHPDLNFISEATDLQIVSGDATGSTFRPEDSVNRAETAKIMNNAANLEL